ncbi:membrane-associated sensor domain-containing protein [Cedecea neteri]|uniref:GGDEF domain-containing protein n=1 Tax=Cedecea neteri TaxID=158822 RepID=UPI0028A0FA42|nr:membrane-associated sensor domain-containing protein [Cedecea neteri]
MLSERRKPTSELELRLAMMRQRSVTISTCWFLWLNLLFSGFIFGRDIFKPLRESTGTVRFQSLLDGTMIVISVLCAATLFIINMVDNKQSEPLRVFTHRVIALLSPCWALGFFILLSEHDVRTVFPFASLLIFSALISLYSDTRALCAFVIPVWLVAFAGNLFYPTGDVIFLSLIYLLVAAVFESGRRILHGWCRLAMQRELENNALIHQLKSLANRDPLTGIANRRSFQLLLDKSVQRGQQMNASLSLIMVDVDHFKNYNDRYGHLAGDECLIRVAHILEASVRHHRDLVARFGGEEFIILLPGASSEEAVLVAQRIQRNLAQAALEHSASPVNPAVTVSLGIAGWSKEISTSRLIAEADAALYSAKEQGRNRWHRYGVESSARADEPVAG